MIVPQSLRLGESGEDCSDGVARCPLSAYLSGMWMPCFKGQYSGKTVPQIILADPDYFYWAIERGDFFKGKLADEASEVFDKSRRVRIPNPNPADWRVEYVFAYDGKFSHFDIVERDRPEHVGSSTTIRSESIDFRVVRRSRGYDKSGYDGFIHSFKVHVLGNPKVRLTKKRCEEFFSDPSNFV